MSVAVTTIENNFVILLSVAVTTIQNNFDILLSVTVTTIQNYFVTLKSVAVTIELNLFFFAFLLHIFLNLFLSVNSYNHCHLGGRFCYFHSA